MSLQDGVQYSGHDLASKERSKMFPQSCQFNRPPHVNPGLLHDQGLDTKHLVLRKLRHDGVVPVRHPTTPPLRPLACIANIKHTTR